eukprot:3299897-Alexandrium_andersonii.AAC.1
MSRAGHGGASADARGRGDEAHLAGASGTGAPGALGVWRAGGPPPPPEPLVTGAALGTTYTGSA